MKHNGKNKMLTVFSWFLTAVSSVILRSIIASSSGFVHIIIMLGSNCDMLLAKHITYFLVHMTQKIYIR
jgi:hypothetical protein